METLSLLQPCNLLSVGLRRNDAVAYHDDRDATQVSFATVVKLNLSRRLLVCIFQSAFGISRLMGLPSETRLGTKVQTIESFDIRKSIHPVM